MISHVSGSRARTLVLAILLAWGLPSGLLRAQVCGDYNESGALTSADIFQAFNIVAEYYYPNHAPEFWGVDGHDEYTIRDAVIFTNYVFEGTGQVTCSDSAEPLFPLPSTDFIAAYDRTFPADSTVAGISFDLICHRPISGALVGYRLLLDGLEPDDIHSNPLTGASGRSCLFYHPPPDTGEVEQGICLFGFTAFGSVTQVGRKKVANLYVYAAASSQDRTISLELVDFDTLLADSLARHFTAVVDDNLDMWTLQNIDDICPVRLTGDGDMSGALTSSDIITLVNYVFKSGPSPLPCAAAGDVNCDTNVTSSDVIYLVNHIFKGEAAPCDVCSIYAQSECE